MIHYLYSYSYNMGVLSKDSTCLLKGHSFEEDDDSRPRVITDCVQARLVLSFDLDYY